jgi:hypothetical protein
VFLGAIVSRNSARFYNLFNLAGQIIFIYIRRVFPLVGWPVGALTFYAPHEIYLVINQNSSSGGVRFLCDVVVV